MCKRCYGRGYVSTQDGECYPCSCLFAPPGFSVKQRILAGVLCIVFYAASCGLFLLAPHIRPLLLWLPTVSAMVVCMFAAPMSAMIALEK